MSQPNVDDIIDQLTKVTDHFVSTQSELAKAVLSQWTGGGQPDVASVAEQASVAFLDGIGDMVQGWFSWMQLADALTGSHWSPNWPHWKAPGEFVKNVEITAGKNDVDLVPGDLTDGAGHTVDAKWITLVPKHVPATTKRAVAVVVHPPQATTPKALYKGSVYDATSKAALADVEILIDW